MKYHRARSDGEVWAALTFILIWLLMLGCFWGGIVWIALHFLFKVW